MTDTKSFLERLDVGLELGVELRQQLYHNLHSDWITPMIDDMGFWDDSIAHRKEEMLRDSILVDDCLFADLYKNFLEAKANLGYKDPVDLFVYNNSEINAFASYSFNKDDQHIIVLHSALVNSFSDKQIQCIIGHELGHLMNGDSVLNRLVEFFYPDRSDRPDRLDYQLALLAQLNELRADRCSYIACGGDLDAAVLAFLCMTTGVPESRFSCDSAKYIERCYQNLEYIRENRSDFNDDAHPEVPVRVCALEIFAKETENETIKTKTREILSLLHDFSDNTWNINVAYAIAGWLVAMADNKVNKMELGTIFENLATQGNLFPEKLIDQIKTKSKKELQNDLTEYMELSAFSIDDLISYMLSIVVADNEINKKELDFVRNFAGQCCMSPEEFSQCYAQVLQSFYRPIVSMGRKDCGFSF